MLKKALIQTLHAFSSFIPLGLLQSISQQRLLSLFYHTISDDDLPHIKHLYRVRDSKTFRQDLDYLLQHYEPIDLSQLIEHVHKGRTLPKNAFFLTFDDGLSECYHVIAPILKEKGIPATFFLNSDFVDNKALMFRYKASYLIDLLLTDKAADSLLHEHFSQYQLPYKNVYSLLKVRWLQQTMLDDIAQAIGLDFKTYLQAKQPYLSQQQVQSMHEDGFTFGSHSQNHPMYQSIPLEQQVDQTLLSQQYIQEQFQIPYKVFAFPFTDTGVSKAFFKQILEEEKFQLTFGGAGIKHETISGQLQRFGIETQENTSIKSLIHSEYCYYLIKALFRKNTIHRQ